MYASYKNLDDPLTMYNNIKEALLNNCLKTFLFAFSCVALSACTVSGGVKHKEKGQEMIADAFEELDNDNLTLHFLDALSGNGIAGAEISIAKTKICTSDVQGKVKISNTLEDGNYIVHFEKQGYVTSDFEIEIAVGTLFFNRFSISPSLDAKYVRIVLMWDKTPKDLDAHMEKKNEYHISYRNSQTSNDGACGLDRDAQQGYGPETITLTRLDKNGRYEYFVENYSDKGKNNLNKSKAVVAVYADGRLFGTYRIPQNYKGDRWNVFTIMGGVITVTP
jgi:5-hydroxyisourate hydrolase-like protein (transthyretin family)